MIAASGFWIVFRFIHVVSAILWAGALFALTIFVEPTAAALGPDGGKFMGAMVQKRKVPQVMAALAGLTVLGGVVLYLKDSSGLKTEWITTPTGTGFTIGAIAAIAAFVIGMVGARPAAAKIGALAAEIQGAGGPPSPEQAATMKSLVERFRLLSRISLALVLIAAAAMATARYW